MLPRQRPAAVEQPVSTNTTSDGAAQSLDQIANWVRFSDAKATILAAGFGVVLAALVANSGSLIGILRQGTPTSIVLAVVLAAALVVGVLTLFWVTRAILPHTNRTAVEVNRFSWPSLATLTPDELAEHIAAVPASEDAWAQAVNLAKLAQRKFRHTRRAVWGFGAFVVLGSASIAMAVASAT